jgi:hypothetical protein
VRSELPIIQKTYELLLWMVPTIQKLPRSHRFVLGERLESSLYRLLEDLVRARFARPPALLAPLTRPHGLPIGSLLSQHFAVFYLDSLDHLVKEQLRVPGYLRYADRKHKARSG